MATVGTFVWATFFDVRGNGFKKWLRCPDRTRWALGWDDVWRSIVSLRRNGSADVGIA
jgi:hypothetical protein